MYFINYTCRFYILISLKLGYITTSRIVIVWLAEFLFPLSNTKRNVVSYGLVHGLTLDKKQCFINLCQYLHFGTTPLIQQSPCLLSSHFHSLFSVLLRILHLYKTIWLWNCSASIFQLYPSPMEWSPMLFTWALGLPML